MSERVADGVEVSAVDLTQIVDISEFERLALPQIPEAFTGSELCWRGELLWEDAREQFTRLMSTSTTCRTLAPDDAGRRIFGVAIGADPTLAMTLKLLLSRW